MKILAVIDTHGEITNFRKALAKVKPIDYLFHCGDVEGQADLIRRLAGVPCAFVRGNNDFDNDLNYEEVVELGGHRFLIVHGHRHGVYWGTGDLKERAKELGCDIALFGHTHRPMLDESDPTVTVINPGSITLPRQENHLPSYAVIEITPRKQVLVTINYLGRGQRTHRSFLW